MFHPVMRSLKNFLYGWLIAIAVFIVFYAYFHGFALTLELSQRLNIASALFILSFSIFQLPSILKVFYIGERMEDIVHEILKNFADAGDEICENKMLQIIAASIENHPRAFNSHFIIRMTDEQRRLLALILERRLKKNYDEMTTRLFGCFSDHWEYHNSFQYVLKMQQVIKNIRV